MANYSDIPLIHLSVSFCVDAFSSLCTTKELFQGFGVGLTLYLYAGIESEWRKTQCIPREVCVDVGREFGAPTNIFYKPPCVSVYRCGGCCHSEDKQCRNISTGYLSKTVSTFYFLYYYLPKYGAVCISLKQPMSNAFGLNV